ncbi:hypothetical protein [Streptomyces fulvoviolaceus]|uniref:hypothetical protein n=1 Tax=Streptomyces fulvoviolaceus TaxID=285535 RepID=UPI0004C883F3|nr:hypothetical protein [Streptomyces fulvoviolaceus]MCT9075205.1 hypothetical protein [Streptomyces fulvoviolaceus]
MCAGRFDHHGVDEQRPYAEVEGAAAHLLGRRTVTDATIRGTHAPCQLYPAFGHARADGV